MAGTTLLNGDIFVARVYCTSGDQVSINSFYYKFIASAGIQPTDQDVATNLDTVFAPLYKLVLADTDTYNGTQVQIVDPFTPGPTPAAVFDNTNGGLGSIAAAVLPRQTCGISTWQTNFAGRKFRGRTYWPFPTLSFDVGEGVPTNAAVVAYQNIAVGALGFTFIAGFAGTFEQVLFHRNFPHAVPPILPTADVITNVLTHKKWATQRRRGSYGRPNVAPF